MDPSLFLALQRDTLREGPYPLLSFSASPFSARRGKKGNLPPPSPPFLPENWPFADVSSGLLSRPALELADIDASFSLLGSQPVVYLPGDLPGGEEYLRFRSPLSRPGSPADLALTSERLDPDGVREGGKALVLFASPGEKREAIWDLARAFDRIDLFRPCLRSSGAYLVCSGRRREILRFPPTEEFVAWLRGEEERLEREGEDFGGEKRKGDSHRCSVLWNLPYLSGERGSDLPHSTG